MNRFYSSIQLRLMLAALFMILALPSFLQAEEGGLSVEERAKLHAEAKARLDATIWSIEVMPMWGKREERKSTSDELTLDGGKLRSKAFAKQGYGDSNFTLTIGDDRVAVFETMQRNEEEGLVFWRGELAEDDIRGVISVQKPEEEPLSYSFKGQQTGTVAKEPPPSPAGEVAVADDVGLEGGVEEASPAEDVI